MKVLIRVSGTERVSNKEAINKFLKAVRKGIIDDQSGKGIKTTGQSARSLSIQELRAGGQLVGDDYFQQQITGRRPGKFPPLQPIMDWITKKGLDLKGITKKGLAFIIARKIANEGTDIFKKKRQGIDVKSIVKTYEQSLRESFVKAGRIAITSAIAKALKPSQTQRGIRA